jgi:orotidine-5'-phosphate decarboxylase
LFKPMTNDKLIVALDVDSIARARQLISELREHVAMFKVGSQLFTAAGPEIVREIVRSGSRVFLDLKFHDIPNTVAAAGVEATQLGVSIFNVHAAGGVEMMQRTADAVSRVAESEGLLRPAVIAVTVLTSADAKTLETTGVAADPKAQVLRLAALAAKSGMDGVVASPHEVTPIRAAVSRPEFLIVTPGVRTGGTSQDDQKRVMSPAEAIRAGADYLVVGRPIAAADDPIAATKAIIAEIELAEKSLALEEGTAGR